VGDTILGECDFCSGFGTRTVTGDQRECGPCGGSGFSGDPLALLQAQADADYEWENRNAKQPSRLFQES